jgi:hypothetical protein
MRHLTLLVTLAFLVPASIAEEPTIRLEAVARLFAIMKDAPSADGIDVERYVCRVQVALTNISKKTIVVPTSNYGGRAWLLTHDSTSAKIGYSIGSWVFDNRLVSKPSPFRFFPVELCPGESTELPKYEEVLKDPTLFKTVTVEYQVDESYARQQGWWFGRLKTDVKVEQPEPDSEFPWPRKDLPNQPPLQTPTSGTPAAKAPVAPPPGAAGR